jgi:uncharacterized protein HemY
MAAMSISGLGGLFRKGTGRLPRFGAKTWIVVGSLVLVVLLGGAIAALLYSHSQDEKAKHKVFTKYKAAGSPASQAYSYALSGDYATGQKVLDNEVAQAKTVEDKSVLYMTQASLAYNKGDYAQAKIYANQAESAKPTSASAGMLGDIAVKQHDTAAAKQYYQKAISRLDTHAPGSANQSRSYQKKLEAAGV